MEECQMSLNIGTAARMADAERTAPRRACGAARGTFLTGSAAKNAARTLRSLNRSGTPLAGS